MPRSRQRSALTLEPGKTTVLEVSSVIRRENTFFLEFFIPEVSVTVVADGATSDAVPINLRGDGSVAWNDYSGPPPPLLAPAGAPVSAQ